STPTTVYLRVTNDTSSCTSKDSVFINVQDPVNINFGYINEMGDTIKTNKISMPLGDTIYPWVTTDQKYNELEWLDATLLPSGEPILFPSKSRNYTVEVTDTLDCPPTSAKLRVDVTDGTVDAPTAFTPNGDGINDEIRIDGWGIKRLISWKIYNRWGELLFETSDKNEGWDGTYKGKMQNVDTYVYVAKVETLKGNIVTRTGSFTLLK
ncbi:MAG: gliding motility-associated C-terminal domain-containing protein, partial [Bacteroidota bacterium]